MAEIERRVVLGGLAAVGAGALVGCGGGSDGTVTGTELDGTETTPPEATDDPAGTDAPVATDPPVETDAPVQTDAPVETDPPADAGGGLVVGDRQATIDGIKAADNFMHIAESKLILVEYPAEFLDAAKAVYPTEVHVGLEAGLLAINEKCTHSRCTVPECLTSQQLECPCHGSKYSRFGEKLRGPAPRGLDLHPISISDNDEVIVDTATLVEGVPEGTDITGWISAGESCESD